MMCSSVSSFVESPIAVLMARWASSEPSAPRVGVRVADLSPHPCYNLLVHSDSSLLWSAPRGVPNTAGAFLCPILRVSEQY
jgi:hypothetical protein